MNDPALANGKSDLARDIRVTGQAALERIEQDVTTLELPDSRPQPWSVFESFGSADAVVRVPRDYVEPVRRCRLFDELPLIVESSTWRSTLPSNARYSATTSAEVLSNKHLLLAR